jgi:hypothetical protein
MATIDSVKTKMQNLLKSLSTKMGTTYSTFTAAINALPSKKTQSNVSVSGKTVTTPAGIYFSQVQGSVSEGELPTPQISVSSKGVVTATVDMVQSGVVGYIPYDSQKSKTYNLTTQVAKTVTPTTKNQVAVESGKYTTGEVIVKGDANLVPDNIKSGSSIFGVAGTYGGGGNVQTTSVIVDTWNTMSDGYGVDVYYTIFENGKLVNAHQYVETFKDVVLSNDVVMGSVITFISDLYLDDSTNMLFGEATQNYQWAYAYTVSEGAYFMFYE